MYDQVQYAKRHWHNRNRIKTAAGLEWLTIPVISKGRYQQRIDEVEIEKPWADKHWHAIERAYRRAPHFAQFGAVVSGWYDRMADEKSLSKVNAFFLAEI